jgi:hypothetical protein
MPCTLPNWMAPLLLVVVRMPISGKSATVAQELRLLRNVTEKVCEEHSGAVPPVPVEGKPAQKTYI